MQLKAEKKYEFRKRMRCVHQKDVRNPELEPEECEMEIATGWRIVLPEGYGETALTAAKDFQDYLFVSMGVSVLVCGPEQNGGEKTVMLTVAPGMEQDYVITIGDAVTIAARDERGLAQGLYCLEDRMNIRRAPFFKRETISHRFLFSPRMIHSGYGLDEYPDEHLSAIAHAGMDAILVFVKGINATPSGFLDFNELISRAAKYGLDVYAYSYLVSEMHPEEEGAQEFYDKLYGSLFEACPGFKGIILVGESVGFPSNDPHVTPKNMAKSADGIPHGKPRPGWWPCEDYPQWLECVKKAVRRHKKDADIVFWTYNWGYVSEEERLKLIRSLPTDISLQATYEMFESYPAGKITETCADYTLAFAGPGQYFASEAKAAAERGIRLYAMTNTGGMTWDMGTIPYEPMPQQWMERYRGLRETNEKWGLCGLMESHHYGFWPSFIGDLAKQAFIAENDSMEKSLMDVLRARFGEGNEDKICRALELWSEAIRRYTPSDADQYGAFRIGPSYPLCLIKEIKPPSESFAHFGNGIVEVLYPADYSPTNALPCGRGMLPSLRLAGEIASLEEMFRLMKEGARQLKEVAAPNRELLYLTNLGEYICCCVQTGIHAKQWYSLTSKLKAEEKREAVRAYLVDIKALIAAERKNAECALDLVEKDSRLGWEPSMDYIADAEHIRWKLRHLDYVLDFEVKCYENGSDGKWVNE